VVYSLTGSTAKNTELSTHAYNPSGPGTIYLYIIMLLGSELGVDKFRRWVYGRKFHSFAAACKLCAPQMRVMLGHEHDNDIYI